MIKGLSLFAQALFLQKQKKYNEAITDMDESIRLKPDVGEVYEKRGLAKLYLKFYSGAISDYSKALEFNPDDDKSYFGRGRANIEYGFVNKGCSDLKKAKELGNTSADDFIKKSCK